jgi:hypothetical protein
MEFETSLFSQSAWELLAEALETKLARAHSLSEEDLRHSVVEALEYFGMSPKGVIRLDFAHPTFRGKKIDIFLPSYSRQDAIACELKYDRRIPSGKNQAKSMKAGSILNDILRLAHFSTTTAVERFLIYLSDDEMLRYLRNPANGFSHLFEYQKRVGLAIDATVLNAKARSVIKMIKVPILECTAFCVLDRSVGSGHTLLVFFVRPISKPK